MLTPRGDRPPSDDPDEILARARTEAAAIIEAAEERAATLVRDGELRGRRYVSEAVRAGRDRLAHLAEEEREAMVRLAVAQRELQGILDRIARPDPTLIDLTRAKVRFGLPTSPGTRQALGPTSRDAIPDLPVATSGQAGADDTATVTTMIRRAVDEAAARGIAPT